MRARATVVLLLFITLPRLIRIRGVRSPRRRNRKPQIPEVAVKDYPRRTGDRDIRENSRGWLLFVPVDRRVRMRAHRHARCAAFHGT